MDWPEFQRRIRAPSPKELDELAATLLASRPFFIGRKCKRIAPELVRRVLRTPLGAPPSQTLVFLKEAVPADANDDVLLERWRAALQALLDVEAYTWGSKERRNKLVAIIRSPVILQAVQAAVVAVKPPAQPEMELMAVLALDGSEASADALMPHVDHAMKTGEGLGALEGLETYAADTEPMRAMLAKTKSLLAQRSAASPLIAFLREIGVNVDPCHFSMWLASRETQGQVPVVQVNFSLDSRASPYMHLSIDASGRQTSFNDKVLHKDSLGLGKADLAGLPELFARAARSLKVTWDWDGATLYSSLRGRKREAIVRWLAGIR